jgi:hypothetical protein
MNPADYQLWMKQAFLAVEAALSQELLTPSRLCMTEEYLRSAFVRGLAASRPDLAHKIDTEYTATWSDYPCWNGTGAVPGQGRRIQHDIATTRNDGTAEMLCEVKWLKAEKPDEVVRDVWKLLLSRRDTAELAATRTYLLIGGERVGDTDIFAETLNKVKDSGVPLKWSTKKTGNVPPVQAMALKPVLKSARGKDALKNLLKWGSNPVVYRTPPDCCSSWRVKVRAAWLRPDGFTLLRDPIVANPQPANAPAAGVPAVVNPTVSWRVALWEIHRHGTGTDACLDWVAVKGQLKV